MPINRRTFVAATLLGSSAGDSAMAHHLNTLDQPMLTKHDIPTPALLVDLDAFESNVRTLAEHCRAAGCGFRPHAKTHKCPEIARRQVAAGAVGISAATVTEVEALVGAGIRGVLLTSPIVEPVKIARMVELAAAPGAVMLAVGHERAADLLATAAAARGTVVDVLVDVDIGDRRTGALPGEPARELARRIAKSRHLRIRGVQAYAGHASHTRGFEQRRQVSHDSMAKAQATRELLLRDGLEATILSGGSTGTYNIDSSISNVELQVGSYVFMDVNYRRIGGRSNDSDYADFQSSLTVLTTVVSSTHGDRVSVDAGTKAFSTDVTERPECKGQAGLVYTRAGDEFGAITVESGATLPRLGDRIEFYVPHCDPTVNLYDRIYATRGDRVEAIWAVTARKELNGNTTGVRIGSGLVQDSMMRVG